MVDGSQACIILPGVLRSVYWVALGVGLMMLCCSTLIEVMEYLRAGRRYKARKRVVAYCRLAAVTFYVSVLLRCLLLDKEFFFDRVSTWLLFIQSLSIDATASLMHVSWATVAKKTAMVDAGGSELATSSFPTLSTLDPKKLAMRLAILVALVLVATVLVLLPTVQIATAYRAFLLSDLLCSAARLGTSLRALQPVRRMYRELAATSEMFDKSMVPVTKKRLEELETVRATLIMVAAGKFPGHSLQLIWPFACSTAVYAWPIAMVFVAGQIGAWELLALLSTRRYIDDERKFVKSNQLRSAFKADSLHSSDSGSADDNVSAFSAPKKTAMVVPIDSEQKGPGGMRTGDDITQEHETNGTGDAT